MMFMLHILHVHTSRRKINIIVHVKKAYMYAAVFTQSPSVTGSELDIVHFMTGMN